MQPKALKNMLKISTKIWHSTRLWSSGHSCTKKCLQLPTSCVLSGTCSLRLLPFSHQRITLTGKQFGSYQLYTALEHIAKAVFKDNCVAVFKMDKISFYTYGQIEAGYVIKYLHKHFSVSPFFQEIFSESQVCPDNPRTYYIRDAS